MNKNTFFFQFLISMSLLFLLLFEYVYLLADVVTNTCEDEVKGESCKYINITIRTDVFPYQ